MVIKTKQIFVAMICAVFIIGFSVVSKVSADDNPFKPAGSDSFIKTVSDDGGHHDAKCGGPAGGSHDSRVGGKQESKCGSSDVKDDTDDHHHAKCGGPAGGTHDSRVGDKCGGEGKCGS